MYANEKKQEQSFVYVQAIPLHPTIQIQHDKGQLRIMMDLDIKYNVIEHGEGLLTTHKKKKTFKPKNKESLYETSKADSITYAASQL
ncbi:hypothetical protein ACT7DJ_13125 [Bacillus cereus]